MFLKRIIRPAIVNPRVLWTALFIITAYTAAVVLFTDEFPKYHLAETKEALNLSSIAIVLVFGFRINTAYDRWWEGRKLWGQLVNELRNLSIKFPLYFDMSEADRERFARLLTVFPFTLKHHLRDATFDLSLVQLPKQPDGVKHLPLFIASEIYSMISVASAKNPSCVTAQLLVDSHAHALMDICGACERIKKTPISGWFISSIWIWLTSYMLLLPWLLAENLDVWTVPLMVFTGYFGISLELLAAEIQEPFGCDVSDLNTDQICHSIAHSLEQVFAMKLDPVDLADCH